MVTCMGKPSALAPANGSNVIFGRTSLEFERRHTGPEAPSVATQTTQKLLLSSVCLLHRSKQLLPQTQRSHNKRQAGLQAPQLQRHEAGESQQLPVSLRLRRPGGDVCVLCDSGSRDKQSEHCGHMDVQRASAGRAVTYSCRPRGCIQLCLFDTASRRERAKVGEENESVKISSCTSI